MTRNNDATARFISKTIDDLLKTKTITKNSANAARNNVNINRNSNKNAFVFDTNNQTFVKNHVSQSLIPASKRFNVNVGGKKAPYNIRSLRALLNRNTKKIPHAPDSNLTESNLAEIRHRMQSNNAKYFVLTPDATMLAEMKEALARLRASAHLKKIKKMMESMTIPGLLRKFHAEGIKHEFEDRRYLKVHEEETTPSGIEIRFTYTRFMPVERGIPNVYRTIRVTQVGLPFYMKNDYPAPERSERNKIVVALALGDQVEYNEQHDRYVHNSRKEIPMSTWKKMTTIWTTFRAAMDNKDIVLDYNHIPEDVETIRDVRLAESFVDLTTTTTTRL